jgi:hypothetical protein
MLTETASGERVAGAVTGQLSCDQLANSIRVKVKAGDGHHISAGVQLLEAKRRCPEFGMTFSAFFYGKCGLQKSRAYELIARAEGRTNEDEVRAERRERNARYTAKNKAARDSVSVLDGQSPTPDPFSEQRDIVTSAMKGATLADWTKLAKCAADLKAARDVIKDKADRAGTRGANDNSAKPAPKKLTPDALEARRKLKADDKTVDNYFKQFGFVCVYITPDVLRRMEDSLKSGVDDFAELKREKQRQQDEHVRAETLRREALNSPLLAPITAEKEQAYTGLIKRRQLYEGACGLSWAEYFEYRDQHPECDPLTRGDLAYASDWTACAVIPEMDESTVTEKALRERAARHGYKVKRRGTKYNLTDGDGTGPGGTLEALIGLLDIMTPTMEGNEQEALAA